MTPDATTRAAALKIMANGHATIAEIAELVGISRQAVRMWAQRAKIDPVASRENHLSRAVGESVGRPASTAAIQPTETTPKAAAPLSHPRLRQGGRP